MNLKELPAIYATKPYEGTSSSYVFIPTQPILEGLQASGWEIKDARQTRSRSAERAPYARHMIRMRMHGDAPIIDPRGQELYPELVLVNGHDGSAMYRLYSGLFSFLCLNGLVVGSVFAGAAIRHSGFQATLEAVQNGAVKIITEEMPLLRGAVQRMAARQLTHVEIVSFAHKALELRYRGVPPLLTTEQVLTRHRPEDAANDAWTIFNVVQENILSKNHDARSFTGRRSHIRGVKAIKEQININRGLWDYAERLAA